MLRCTILAAAVLALAGSASSDYQVNQRGSVSAPRAALGDGQPLEGRTRIEGHAATTTASGGGAGPARFSSSGAAVTRHQVGGALRRRVGRDADLGVEADGSWAPSATTRSGEAIDAPDEVAMDVALAVRVSTRLSRSGAVRLGWLANVGAHSTPIARTGSFSGVSRDTSVLVRTALVPSLRRGAVTLFGSAGLASETDVPAQVSGQTEDNEDPGAVANTSGLAFTVAAGATVDLGGGAHVTARVGDAFTGEANGHYGPQLDLGLGFAFGK